MRSNKAKVVIIIPSLGIGGAEFFVKRLIEYLRVDVSFLLIVLADNRNEIEIRNSKNLKLMRVQLFQSKNIITIIRRAYSARKSIINFQPYAVQCFLYPAELFSLLLGRKFPIFWSVRGTGNPLEKSILKRLFIRLTLLFANFVPDCIVACSEAARKWAISKGVRREKITVINNFLDDWTEIAHSKSILVNSLKKSFDSRIRIGMAARLDPHKGHDILIEAVCNSVEILNRPMTLSLIGTGTENLVLPRRVESRKSFAVGDFRLELVGPVVNMNQKALWFSNLDIYVMASIDLEGFPNSLYEAIAIGCPYISSFSGNVSDFLNPKYIYLSHNSVEISNLIGSIIKTDSKILKNDIRMTQDILRRNTNRKIISEAYKNIWFG